VFTRYPEAGRSKTRLIPALGAEGAADLQRMMTEHTLAGVRELTEKEGVSAQVLFEGGSEELMQRAFGRGWNYSAQSEGDLGARMRAAFEDAFGSGAISVVLIGTDCPGLDAGLMGSAFSDLDTCDLVLGPAADGGYYLIGLKRTVPELFADIPWGTGLVLDRTLQRAEGLGLVVELLKRLEDVDRPEDLPAWEKVAGRSRETREDGMISVIIPALDEEDHIAAAVAGAISADGVEAIVVDGGSSDRTADLAAESGATVVASEAGRAVQMNKGAEKAKGDILLFAHADTVLPQGYSDIVRRVLSHEGTAAGAFRLRIDGASRGMRVIERLANWRSRRLQMPYGDQGIFLAKDDFVALAGFREMQIMEDFEFIRRLRRLGRIEVADAAARTSARRWQSRGLLTTTLINQAVIAGYFAGVPLRVLARLYGSKRGDAGTKRRPASRAGKGI